MSHSLYLLDANVLIDAHNLYYSHTMVPEFWEWLLEHAANGRIAMPQQTYDEVRGGADATKDELNAWVCDPEVENLLVLHEEVDTVHLGEVIDTYAPDLDEIEIEQIGRDPFLIAYGRQSGRCVVSNEVSKPSKTRANQKVPDVCKKLGVPCCNTFTMLKDLQFSTSWKSGLKV